MGQRGGPGPRAMFEGWGHSTDYFLRPGIPVFLTEPLGTPGTYRSQLLHSLLQHACGVADQRPEVGDARLLVDLLQEAGNGTLLVSHLYFVVLTTAQQEREALLSHDSHMQVR